MERVLVVGCGGSGAKTLAFMMDQLKTMLAERLPNEYVSPKDVKLPDAWQFVSLDVPTKPESAGKNLQNVQEAGGRYISVGSSGRYANVDAAVSARLASGKKLGTISSWALRNPGAETTPISAGAGQYRAIGRMLTLSKLREVQEELEKAWSALNQPGTASELSRVQTALTGRATSAVNAGKDVPLIIVVTSMSGGAGASMAIDVCRLLTSLDKASVGRNCMFAFTPDIFSGIPQDQVMGANPNAMAMFGEMAAAQMGAATESDRRLFEQLGVNLGDESVPISRVFPVGAHSGAEGAQLGDGKPGTVYRALGRGLASLLMDEAAMGRFTQFNLGNQGGLQARDNTYGWGVQNKNNLPWGSFGYAQLSMGRDRYAEYSAQRLARSAVDKLVHGHIDPTNPASGDEQIKQRVDTNWRQIQARTTVIPFGEDVGGWLWRTFGAEMDRWAGNYAESLRHQIPQPNNRRGRDWAPDVIGALNVLDQQVSADNGAMFYGAAFNWASVRNLQEGFLDIIRREVGNFGLPYGSAVLDALKNMLVRDVMPQLEQVARSQQRLALHPETERAMMNARGKIVSADQYMEDIVRDVREQLRRRAQSRMSEFVLGTLADFIDRFIGPLQKAMTAEHTDLEHELSLNNDKDLGVAQLKTNVPQLWPEDTDMVPPRFAQAANEIFLTEIGDFPRQYVHDIQNATSADSYDHAISSAASSVVSGAWSALEGAEQAPQDLIVLTGPWVPMNFTRDPNNPTELLDPKLGQFSVRIGAEEVLERSRKYIQRRGFSFHDFISTSLRSYVTAPALQDHERRQRQQRLASKFTEAMKNALPLAQIDDNLVRNLYGDEVGYAFNFSKIPLEGDESAQLLAEEVINFPNVKLPDPMKPLGDALENQGEERSIDIFGSYPNYVPVVFSSLLRPMREQWDSLKDSRKEFWRAKRARPIQAATPMSDAERRAFIGGWYIGRIIGYMDFPATLDTPDNNSPVKVYDDSEGNRGWLSFPDPLLTPPSNFRNVFDWLPAVIESAPLAWTKAGVTPLLDSYRPYRVMRALFDDADNPSEVGRTLKGTRLLARWLATGERKSGTRLMIKGTGPDVTPEERLAAVKTWLERQREIAMEYVPTDKLLRDQLSVQASRPVADVDSRELAARIPLFADVALDVYEVIDLILRMLDEADRLKHTALDEAPEVDFSSVSRPVAMPTMPGEDDI